MQRAQRLALVLIPVLGSACTLPGNPAVGVSNSAIVGGTTDTGDPSVVLLIGQQPGSNSATLCTGEVISPHVVLTAAHCVDPTSVGSGLQFQIFLGNDINSQAQNIDSNYLDVKETHFDAAFDVNQLEGGHDVAVAVTNDTIPLTPLPVNQDPMSSADIGTSLRLVGYGITSTTSSQDTSGVKRQVQSALSAMDTRFLEFGDAQHNTCEGDSGGPAFITRNGTEVIAGITSFGDQNCEMEGTDTRVDTYWTSFIAPAIMAADGSLPPSNTGGGSTPSASNDGGTSSSNTGNPPDTGDADDGGVTPGQLAGSNLAVGQTCTASSQCASGICTLGATRYCTETCDPNNATSCPVGTNCANVSGANYCVVSEHGCSTAPTGSSSSNGAIAALLLLGLCGLLQRRRFSLR